MVYYVSRFPPVHSDRRLFPDVLMRSCPFARAARRCAVAALRGRRDTRRRSRASPKTDKFPLTVDSIMRGPDLVGYPPDGLRWSADSQKLYFDWRKPGEDEASTYVVGRDGGAPVEVDGRAEEDRAARQRPMGHGAQARPLRRSRRHRACSTAAARAMDHQDHRRREQPAMGAARHRRSPTSANGNLFLVPLDGEPRRWCSS